MRSTVNPAPLTGSGPRDPVSRPRLAVDLAGVAKSYGSRPVLQDVGLQLEQGGFLAVLGPSGCGKTTLLRCIAGFERIDGGRIALGNRAVALPGTHVPAHRRHVAVVPQDGALFPHLSVAGNVGFGLARTQRRGDARIEECLALVDLAGLGDRMPHELSGGQQQRVALARALAPRPRLVLLDEPFGALDASLRVELRRDIRAALHEDGATAILVTHDQDEALSMADRVVVLREGRVRQDAVPSTVYAQPADSWVASFVGDADLLPFTGADPAGRVRTAVGPVEVRSGGPGATHLVLRPEQVRIDPAGTGTGEGPVATVRDVEFYGHDTLTALALPDGTVIRSRSLAAPASVGDRVRVRVVGPVWAVPDGGHAR
ncbi:ABC transporter ATP-binding protein [Citricoccus zhacaiensis]|uniref:ABC transporter ATP-binding protein n=1 Tax=Citricoccus zhacaiensis TaxID=489142 RepID=UPI003CEBEB69